MRIVCGMLTKLESKEWFSNEIQRVTITTVIHNSRIEHGHSVKACVVGTKQRLPATEVCVSSSSCYYSYDNVSLKHNEQTTPITMTTDSATVRYTVVDNSHLSSTNLQPATLSTKTSQTKYHYGLRYYSPELGRWVSRDPINELAFSMENASVSFVVLSNYGETLFLYNDYALLANSSIDQIDYLGLCDTSCRTSS
jgi:RHS repeat-associated protein